MEYGVNIVNLCSKDMEWTSTLLSELRVAVGNVLLMCC